MERFIDASVLVLMLASGTLVAAWIAGAIYFDACGESRWGRWIALGWVAGVIALFAVWRPIWQPFIVFSAVLAAFIVWWLRLKPSHDRDWSPEVAVLPHAERSGDAITIRDIRNFEYRSPQDVTPRYETRTYHLSNARGVDLVVFNWGSKWMSHPVLVFDFGLDGRVCISIEVRYRKGQKYSILYSLFRKYELIFLVSDERDAILRRTRYTAPQEAHLYRFNAPPDEVRVVFADYVEAIGSLYRTPRWYHGLCTNCTTSFYQLPNSRCRCDWRVIVNGQLDRALYEDRRLDTSLAFPELRRLSRINEIVNCAPETGFGDYLRHELERRRHDR